MRIIVDKEAGFCFGVRHAIDVVKDTLISSSNVACLGNIIHNERVVGDLRARGLDVVDSIEDARPSGDNPKLVVRCHGEPEATYTRAREIGLDIVDTTCVFVQKIHRIVSEHYSKGYAIVIYGKRGHAETIGINGWCNNSAIIVQTAADIESIPKDKNVCLVSQTTMEEIGLEKIFKKILKHTAKTIEYFNTICYTTSIRQKNATKLASISDIVLVIGSESSSNTTNLYNICKELCNKVYLLQDIVQIKKINFSTKDVVGITAGASTPYELIVEVVEYMSKEFSEAKNSEFLQGIEESFVNYQIGKRVKGTVIKADDNGISVDIGGKLDGLIKKEDFAGTPDGYDSSLYPRGCDIDAVIISKKDPDTNCILLSKNQIDSQRASDKLVDSIRDGKEFDVLVDAEIKGGVTGKYGTYSIFIPASQVSDYFTKDIKQFVGQTLKVVAIEIDDKKKKMVASAKIILEKERKAKEEVFWTHVEPGMIVTGTVKRFADYGAFVSVDGIDCLAHNGDLSYNRIVHPSKVLELGAVYDFLVIKMDKEKGRISLGYKQLKTDPFIEAIEKYSVGSDAKGKVIKVFPYGAFIELEKGVDGLVHVSEAAHGFVKNINDILKVGQEVTVRILGIDPNAKKINLSIKATQEPIPNVSDDNAKGDNAKASSRGKKASNEAPKDEEWSEESQNNPFAALLKDMDVTKK